jgi:tRNA pseudouridine55 synthase
MDGIVIIDKPGGMTSHDVVIQVRRILNTPKAGHLGTLDPMATGVLPVCVGRATRIGQFIDSSGKEYTGEIRFGFSTTTYDREGAPAGPERAFSGAREEIEEALRQLTGWIDQTPPPYSAKKIGGVPSYKLARRGRHVENAPVRVEVREFELLRLKNPFLSFRVSCSAGTYIRSLAHDLGQRMGCGAHLTSLRRTRSGEFLERHAVALDTLSPRDVLPLEGLLGSLPLIEVAGIDETRVIHGNRIRAAVDGRRARIFNKRGEFLAVADLENGWASPRLVLTSITSNQ